MSDPFFYIPLTDLEEGPAKISKDKSYDQGFWIGTLSLDDERIKIAGFDAGPLSGYVKIPVGSLGKSMAFSHGTTLVTSLHSKRLFGKYLGHNANMCPC